ncbi:MAG: DUF2969 domain-containing protein [Liquorilactobacillus ghanensis]|uniref:DUF2969 domain-containing protein n=1 Tax=Liquorilactobacillus ghanensis TaxID=399370 RepID=UPI0039EACD24
MSKKEKNIEVVEEEKSLNGQTILELKIAEKILGQVIPDGQRFQAVFPDKSIFRTVSQKEAVNLLLRNYHLHRLD